MRRPLWNLSPTSRSSALLTCTPLAAMQWAARHLLPQHRHQSRELPGLPQQHGLQPYVHIMLSHMSDHQSSPWRNPPEQGRSLLFNMPYGFDTCQGLAGTSKKALRSCILGWDTLFPHTVENPWLLRSKEARDARLYPLRRATSQ